MAKKNHVNIAAVTFQQNSCQIYRAVDGIHACQDMGEIL